MKKEMILPFEIILKPNELVSNVNINKLLLCSLSERYLQKIYNGKIICQFHKAILEGIPRVITNGNIKFYCNVECCAIDLNIDDKLVLEISSTNKMGAFYKSDQLTIFIPKHLCIDNEIPCENSSVDVMIVGKRITDKIVCVAKII